MKSMDAPLVLLDRECSFSLESTTVFSLFFVTKDDSKKDIEFISRKLLNMRIFDGENGKSWDKSVVQKDLELLIGSI